MRPFKGNACWNAALKAFLSSAYNDRVRGHYQIVVSTQPPGEGGQGPVTFWSRFKRLFAGIAILTVSMGVLVAALIFGSVLAAVLWVCLVLVIAAVVLKTTWRGLKR